MSKRIRGMELGVVGALVLILTHMTFGAAGVYTLIALGAGAGIGLAVAIARED